MSTQTEEQHAAVDGEGSMGVGANAKAKGSAQASKKSEKKAPKKLGSKAAPQQDSQVNGDEKEETDAPNGEADEQQAGILCGTLL